MTQSMAKLCDIDWVKRKSAPIIREPLGALRVADFFCGLGGMSIGAQEAARLNKLKCEIALAVDYSEKAVRVYGNALPQARDRVICADVDALPIDQDFQKKIDIDLFLAGPPCQGHSDLNNHTRRSDPRNRLYLKTVEHAIAMRPRAIVIENVRSVIHDQSSVVPIAQEMLEEVGYSLKQLIVHAENFGVPQKRRRHFLIGRKKGDVDFDLIDIECRGEEPTVRNFIGDIEGEAENSNVAFHIPSNMSSVNKVRAEYLIKNNLYELPDEYRPKCHRDKKHTYKSVYGRLKWDRASSTITTGFGSMGQGRFLHPSDPRVITPHEAARLQGLPDFLMLDKVENRNDLQTLIGNAVPPQVVAAIVSKMLEMKWFEK